MPITYINPVADCMVPANPYTLSVDLSRPVSIGLLINKIVDCDVFMYCVGEALTSQCANISVKSYETGEITFASSALIAQVADECDAAVCAIGHCGSCTAGTVKDGVALVEEGVPAVSLVTDLFWEQAEGLARSLGWPEAPRVKLPYPVWGTGKQNMHNIAEAVALDILEKLEGTRVEAA